MNTTQSDLMTVATDAESDDEDDEPACACEDGFPGCFAHWLENGGYDDDEQ